MPADIHRSVQHVTLENVPVDVLPRLFLWFSQAKHFECHHIDPPQEVVCAHVQCGLGCTSHLHQSLFDRNWVGAGGGGGAVWGKLGGARESCGRGGSCVWELCPSIEGKVIRGRCARAWQELCGVELCWRSCGGAMFHSCHRSVQYVTLWHVQ